MAGQPSLHQIELKPRLMWRARQRGEIVSAALYSSSWVFSTFIWTVPHVFACSPRCASLCRSSCGWFLSLWCRLPGQPSRPSPAMPKKPGAKSEPAARPAKRLGAPGLLSPRSHPDPQTLAMSWGGWQEAPAGVTERRLS